MYHERVALVNTTVFPICAGIPGVESFGQRVRRLREQRQMTQTALGRLAGVRQSAIANIENGQREGSRNVAKLAAALGVDPYYLETGKGRQSSLSDDALRIARLFSDLPIEKQKALAPIIEAAIGPALSDQHVEERMPITKGTKHL